MELITEIPIKIFIGFDSRESIAYHVLCHSLIRRSSVPLSITPLVLSHLRNEFTRENVGTTEFSLTRFLVPYLAGFEGHPIFMDCDMLARVDMAEILPHILEHPHKTLVCQHDYVPKTTVKATGVQTLYPRKNWSSFIVFNARECKKLTPEYVNTASPMELHRFMWLPNDHLGALPIEWNWLVGEYPHNDHAKILHYTLGTPCFPDYALSDHAYEWHVEKDLLINNL